VDETPKFLKVGGGDHATPTAERLAAGSRKPGGADKPMQRRRVVLSLTLCTLGFACIVLGANYWTSSLLNPNDRQSARAFLASASPLLPLEQRLAGDYLTACTNILTHWTFGIEPSEDRRGLTEICDGYARQQRALDGESSEAALTEAAIAHLDGRPAEVVAQVYRSQALAPRDLWSAIKRIDLIVTALPEAVLSEHRGFFSSEFSLLTGTYAGLETAVLLYARYPVLRPALLDIAEDMTPQDRLRFLNRIKKVVGG
jgi:hypothetical protein